MPFISPVGFALILSFHSMGPGAHPAPDVERVASYSRSEPGPEGGEKEAEEAAATIVAAKCRSESDKRTWRHRYGPANGKIVPPVVRTESPREKCIRKGLAASRKSRNANGHVPAGID